MQNFIFLACLEVAEKFVVVVGGWWWVVCKPILVFSLSLGQAEQYFWLRIEEEELRMDISGWIKEIRGKRMENRGLRN